MNLISFEVFSPEDNHTAKKNTIVSLNRFFQSVILMDAKAISYLDAHVHITIESFRKSSTHLMVWLSTDGFDRNHYSHRLTKNISRRKNHFLFVLLDQIRFFIRNCC